tara:strand:- start:1130 stop:2185 length:1056 start_codon:yes stop_codon:yes gene_type:complete
MSYERLRMHIDRHFPRAWERVNPDGVSIGLIIQIRGSDVHPDVRHPDFFWKKGDPQVVSGKAKEGRMRNKKTQIDITGSSFLDAEVSPVSALFGEGDQTGIYHPVVFFDPVEKKWIDDRTIKLGTKIPNGPSSTQSRLLLGGVSEPDSWSTGLWAKMGHYDEDKFGFIVFLREGKSTPVSFSLRNHSDLEDLLLEHGASRGQRNSRNLEGRMRHQAGAPRSKSAVIKGPSKIPTSLRLEFMYVVTSPDKKGWVKIGRTEQSPRSRLRQYNNGPVVYDMNFIIGTSDCKKSEREVMKRLNMLGTDKTGLEWYRLGSIGPAIDVIKEVVKAYPPVTNVDYGPIILSEGSWVDS